MIPGDSYLAAPSRPLYAFETVDQIGVEVRREQDGIWALATDGKSRRVMPLYLLVVERTKIAAQARNEAMAASLVAATRTFARGVRRLFRSLPPPRHHPSTAPDINDAAVNSFAVTATNSWRSS